jgi:hypothetical protein
VNQKSHVINNDDKESFKKNLMLKLREEYNEGQLKIPFDLEKIRRNIEDGGFGEDAWDDIHLQELVEYLVSDGLIEELGHGQYQISDPGLDEK